jgi:hypothetical protein
MFCRLTVIKMGYSGVDEPGFKGVHHIMGRGIDKTNILITDEDRKDFVSRLVVLAETQPIKIYS